MRTASSFDAMIVTALSSISMFANTARLDHEQAAVHHRRDRRLPCLDHFHSSVGRARSSPSHLLINLFICVSGVDQLMSNCASHVKFLEE